MVLTVCCRLYGCSSLFKSARSGVFHVGVMNYTLYTVSYWGDHCSYTPSYPSRARYTTSVISIRLAL